MHACARNALHACPGNGNPLFHQFTATKTTTLRTALQIPFRSGGYDLRRLEGDRLLVLEKLFFRLRQRRSLTVNWQFMVQVMMKCRLACFAPKLASR